MATHYVGRLPWKVAPSLMKLFAGAAMRAALGAYYIPNPDGGELDFKQIEDDGHIESFNLVWSESPQHVGARHQTRDLDAVAKTLEFEALCSCFGAPTAWSDGQYCLDRPGRYKVFSAKSFSDGLRPRELYVIDWTSEIDWAAEVERAYPKGAGLGAKLAATALMPSAALGIPCPPSALALATPMGLERALSVALLWSNANASKQIHGRLCEKSKDPEASVIKAKALCEKFMAQRSKAKKGASIDPAAQAVNALFEALVLASHAKGASAEVKRKRLGL